jgi:hypothetical protein
MRQFRVVIPCMSILWMAQTACEVKKPGSVRIDPALEALIPADTVFIVGGNIDAVRETPIYQKLLSRVPLVQLDEFTRQTGVDPRKDIAQVLSCSNGKDGVLMARGKFNVADIERRLEARGAPRSSYKNRDVFGRERLSFVFPNASTAIVGPVSDLHSIIDRGSGGGLPPALRDLVRTIPANDQVWAALTGGVQSLNLGVPRDSNLANIVGALKSIDTAIIGMDLHDGIGLTAEVACKTERDAKFVHDMLKGVVGIGRLNTPDSHPELLKLYDAIQVAQQQNHTQVTAQIPADLADRFLDLWLKR